MAFGLRGFWGRDAGCNVGAALSEGGTGELLRTALDGWGFEEFIAGVEWCIT